MTVFSHPSQLNPLNHRGFLTLIRERLGSFPEKGQIQVRDWDFSTVEGVFTVQVFLDKGLQHPKLGRMKGLLLDECAAVHHYLMEKGVFQDFGDELSFEVGSAGINPRLREVSDFETMLGCWVSVETWERIENRRKYVMILDGIETNGNEPAIRLCEGTNCYVVPVSSVRRAEALLDRGLLDGSKRASKKRVKNA